MKSKFIKDWLKKDFEVNSGELLSSSSGEVIFRSNNVEDYIDYGMNGEDSDEVSYSFLMGVYERMELRNVYSFSEWLDEVVGN